MDLRLAALEFEDFRNYETLDLHDIGGLTLFVGPNAVGKTNVLEGIQLLTAGQSFRHPQISQMIRAGKQRAVVFARETDGNRFLDVRLAMEEGKRRYAVNGKAKSVSDVKGNLPAVVFAPDDLLLAKGSSGVKRTALDDLGSQLTKNYDVVKHDYEKIVRYKNRLLKEAAPTTLIESINDTLVICASQLFCYRIALFDRLAHAMGDYYSELSSGGERLTALYCASWDASRETSEKSDCLPGETYGNLTRSDVQARLTSELERALPMESMRGRSLIGPHADRIRLALDGADVSDFASQGQQRSVVLAWKLAEVHVVEESLQQHPVLLLDDVMSELDDTRRDALVAFVKRDIQTFITATNLELFSPRLLEDARVVKLPFEGDRTR